jgi:DNA-binding phage protein
VRKRIVAAGILGASVLSAVMSNWTLTYLRHVMDATGLKGAELAHKAGIAASTINRPLSDANWPHLLSHKTLAAVALATGISFKDFEPDSATSVAPFVRSDRAPTGQAPDGDCDMQIQVDGNRAHLVATVTLDCIEALRRKIDLLEALLRG